ncbi:MAG: site-specific DNA-methyltransferase [Ktedonobacterales bacterium]
MADQLEDVLPVPGTNVLAQHPSTARRDELFEQFRDRIAHNPALDRTLVSFQANKSVPFYGWFKYREGFSEQLVRYLINRLHQTPGDLLDPFAGGGAALFAARSFGWRTTGVEVLPVGIHAMKTRLATESVDAALLQETIARLEQVDFGRYCAKDFAFHHIPITRGAFPEAEERQFTGYMSYCHRHVRDESLHVALLYAAFCVLEEISYTRKDGQYLRWDARSGRSQGKRPFNKGRIIPFREALFAKLRQISSDLQTTDMQGSLFAEESQHPERPRPNLMEGSSLYTLPTLEQCSIDFVVTSPPYANRYDYTRTYALELVYLGCSAERVKELRQAMLSCTVENREKREQLRRYYQELGREQDFTTVDQVFREQAALQEVLALLDGYRAQGKLNNDNIARLVRNYFYEMCFVVFELSRVLRPGGIVAMVNDNVRYAGEEVPVDLILSDFAESFGLHTRHIWTLGRGKGNSSQQMGSHGRAELRKCVYVWEKSAPTVPNTERE